MIMIINSFSDNKFLEVLRPLFREQKRGRNRVFNSGCSADDWFTISVQLAWIYMAGFYIEVELGSLIRKVVRGLVLL